jgi:hypothetical protein
MWFRDMGCYRSIMSSLGPKKPPLGSGDEDSPSGALRPVTVASADTVELLMLMRSNYHDWSLIMKVSLEALGLWEAVEADNFACSVGGYEGEPCREEDSEGGMGCGEGDADG